jgi:RNA polymerase sigma-70 factor (ECF subfamily)
MQAPGVKQASDFASFMRNYQDMVFSTAARLLGDDAQAEDISQNVFLKAYERFDELRDNPTTPGWLKTVATNMSLNHLTRYRKRWSFFGDRRRDDGDDESEEAALGLDFSVPDTLLEGIEDEERHDMVEAALQRLPEHQRVPLVMFHFGELPYTEIATQLKISVPKVKSDIFRGRAALLKSMVEAGKEYA